MTDAEAKAWFARNVSRETTQRLEVYAAELLKWQKAINLVSASTLPDLWTRHFLDSAQVFEHAETLQGLWVDIGSGAGFPGLVCAAMAADSPPDLTFTFIESDLRKGSFLTSTAAKMGLKIRVLPQRIEEAPPQNADILSARALTSLSGLCAFAERHLAPGGTALFLKGATHAKEIEEALEAWTMKMDILPSQTAEGAVILKIGEISRA